ncbi:MAG TPA: GNAT family N-acetyltransferase [Gemmatimonadales bacterium]|nr:GNAT family N-acetyltransferase [Gemmatimonadales bacterium]
MPAEPGGSLLAAVEERFLVPVYTSRHARFWVASHRALALPLTLRGPLTRYEGSVAGERLRIACAGRPKRFEFLLGRLAAERLRGDTPAVRLWSPATLAALDADLVAANVHRWVAPTFARAGWLLVPDAVRWRAATAYLPPRSPGRSLASNLRKAERLGCMFEPAGTPADWREFFDAMVVPLATTRHGERAWMPSHRFRRTLERRATLYFLRRGGMRVAGICSVRGRASVWYPLIGVRDADPELLANGITTAVLAAAFAAARAEGILWVDCGRTDPFPDDGVAWAKRAWGFVPVRDPLAHLVALRCADGGLAARLFARTPVFVERGGTIEVAGGGDDAA